MSDYDEMMSTVYLIIRTCMEGLPWVRGRMVSAGIKIEITVVSTAGGPALGDGGLGFEFCYFVASWRHALSMLF